MSGAGVTVSVNDAEMISAIRNLQRRVADMEPALGEIGSRLENSTLQRFETQTSPEGIAWKASLRAKRQKGQTLTDTARLRQSITHNVRRGEVEVGTNVVYAAIHQFGGHTGPRTIRPVNRKALYWPGAAHPVKKVEHPGSDMPKRAFLGISQGDRRAIIRIIERHVTGANG